MKKIVVIVVSFATCVANAWMEAWAPATELEQANVRKLPPRSVQYFVNTVMPEEGEFRWEYSEGGAVDLNGDGVEDFMFIVPWMGCGLNAAGYTAYFVVSSNDKGRILTTIEGYGIGLEDVVVKGERVYYRHSDFFEVFEKSKHNHWVYQMFSFGKDGVMRCANGDFEGMFPAATIFYESPKFKRVELTRFDLDMISTKQVPSSQPMPH